MSRALFQQLAAYNRWANARLYAAAMTLPDEAYRRPVGVFFSSLHGTLNHLLTTDRLWLKRLTGEGDHPTRLDTIIHDDLTDLALARHAEDKRIITVIDGYSDVDLSRRHAYRTTSGQPQEQRLSDILLHVFNHQTHHRGQAHACYSILTRQEPPTLDLLAFQRGAPAPHLNIDENAGHRLRQSAAVSGKA
ncbi:DinB family protein [Beijerinckia indica]|uniref:DinB family protein n=1 Tax=Beijerinckia indica subsp. indica (strain ATCC 9039 / DSM 1715 / NCIMB 8712) TaxID=395963 RepID=B2IFU7_BEII9|nr:DinB family protein [Beijerinckia indica]ACB95686.1 DinB family protein [Beijerinckia indica subsp. indica ATCC 9039]